MIARLLERRPERCGRSLDPDLARDGEVHACYSLYMDARE
jgi:hypothetical protein